MGLFGEYTTLGNKPKKNSNLLDMAQEKFGDDKLLLDEIKLYLQSCRQKHLYPSKISWEMQLNILEGVAEEKRVDVVHNSILKGYRQIAYEHRPIRSVQKSAVGNILTEGF